MSEEITIMQAPPGPGTSWHSYPSLYNLGHRALEKLFDGPVVIQEKVDGSQFSFGVFDGVLKCRSKGAQLDVLYPQQMFAKGVETVKRLQPMFRDGYTYRCEYLAKPKHNTLAYDRIPSQHIIIYDIQSAEETYLSPDEVRIEATRLGLEVVPTYAQFLKSPLTTETVRELLTHTSVLGGQKIEGIVIKNYTQFGPDKKVLIGKFVSEEFKEIHGADWKDRNPGQGDVIALLATEYRTPARWNKAIQHLRDDGKLEDSPRDIGMLLKEINVDILKECEQEIKDKLWKWAWSKLSRELVNGFPAFYKEELMKRQLNFPAPNPDIIQLEDCL